MEVARTISGLRAAILEHRRASRSVGFVPTSGLIHEGQLSLAQRARSENGCVVVSGIGDDRSDTTGAPFVRDEARDLALLERENVDLAFLPDADTIFPSGSLARVALAGLTDRLDGASRPGHLDHLATTTLKLINLVGPGRLYLGQKDAQRVVMTRRLIRDLFLNLELVVCPTVRDSDGLALSSANAALSIEDRMAAACLQHALSAAEAAYDGGERSAEVLRARMTEILEAERRVRVDYVSVADADSLAELQRVAGPALALLAVRVGSTRLTDSLPLG